MTLARMVVPGRTYMLTRKCVGDRLYLNPTKRREEEQIYLYCLVLTALELGIELNAFCAMGNHHHVVFTDPLGVMPDFLQRLHSLLARAMNCRRGRSGSLFEGAKKSNVVHLVQPADILDEMVYATMNPVAANLVARPEEWPGAVSLPRMYAEGHEIVVRKPKRLFRQLRRDGSASGVELDVRNARHRARMHQKEKEPKPDVVRIALTVPPGFEHLDRAEFQTLYAARVTTEQQAIDAERQARRRPRPWGVKAILAQDWREPPVSKRNQQQEKEQAAERLPAQAAPKPKGPKEAKQDDFLFPHIRCAHDSEARAKHRKAMLEFWAKYRAAYEAFRRRKRGVVFPFGTWGPKRLYNARVARVA